MKKTSATVIFFGSGPVAAKSLTLLEQNFTIEAVVTKPRPPHHKGAVPVLEAAERLNLPIYSTADKQALSDLVKNWGVTSKVAVLIDFGVLVPQELIDYFPLGILNSHFSLLPEWRGADPITFAILSGQEKTGVSLMLVTAGIDEGPLLAQSALTIQPTTTTPSLTEELINLSDTMLTSLLPKYMDESIKPYPQDLNSPVTYSRKLHKDDGLINWEKPADQIEREVRAFVGWPKSRTSFGKIDVIITQVRIVDYSGKPGTTTIENKLPIVYCGQKALVIEKLKPSGKPEMTGEAFLNGYGESFKI